MKLKPNLWKSYSYTWDGASLNTSFSTNDIMPKKSVVFVQIENSRWGWPMQLCKICFYKVFCHLSALQWKTVSPHERVQKKDYILAVVLQHFLGERKCHIIKYLNTWNLVWWMATFLSFPLKNVHPWQVYVYEINLPIKGVCSICNCNKHVNYWR